jgi:hypothetical protein
MVKAVPVLREQKVVMASEAKPSRAGDVLSILDGFVGDASSP